MMATRRVHCRSGKPYDVYIGRGPNSPFGNPFIFEPSTTTETTYRFKTVRVRNRAEAVARYKDWVVRQPELVNLLPTLKNKVLGCWCKGSEACHGDVLIELVDGTQVATEEPREGYLF